MSLDVYLTVPNSQTIPSYVPVRVNGTIERMSEEEYVRQYGREPVAKIEEQSTNQVYSGNCTHNLGRMAREAEVYQCCWHPEELSIEFAHQLIVPLSTGLVALLVDRQKFERFNPENGWGNYDVLVDFIRSYLKACIDNPQATVSVWR